MEERDKQLWRIAKKRAGFKKHLASYIIVNGFLWAVWWFTGHDNDMWPVWPCLGWGIGLAFSYYGAYHDNRDEDTMKEYQKLKDNERKQ